MLKGKFESNVSDFMEKMVGSLMPPRFRSLDMQPDTHSSAEGGLIDKDEKSGCNERMTASQRK